MGEKVSGGQPETNEALGRYDMYGQESVTTTIALPTRPHARAGIFYSDRRGRGPPFSGSLTYFSPSPARATTARAGPVQRESISHFPAAGETR